MHWWILLQCFAVLVFDGLEIALASHIEPTVISDWHMARFWSGFKLWLGATFDKCATKIDAALSEIIGQQFDVFRRPCASASGLSFGTLLSVALLTASKHGVDTVQLTCADIVRLIREITRKLSARDGANSVTRQLSICLRGLAARECLQIGRSVSIAQEWSCFGT